MADHWEVWIGSLPKLCHLGLRMKKVKKDLIEKSQEKSNDFNQIKIFLFQSLSQMKML